MGESLPIVLKYKLGIMLTIILFPKIENCIRFLQDIGSIFCFGSTIYTV